ncbi:MAG: DUF3631 domain-containing protein, partial [Pseudonocardiaceae bacterium]
ARARRACTAMTAEAEQADTEASLGRLLLAGVREAFTTTRLAEIPSAELVTYLRAIEDAPWSAFDLDQRKLARRLNEYAVTPGQIYVTEPGGKRRQARGYRLTGFTDAFARYLSDPSDDSRPDASSSVTPSSEQVTPVTDNGRVTDTSVTQTVSVTGLSSADDEVTDHDAPDPQTAEPRCATCTQPLLLRTPGRKQCERCRLKEKP